MTDLEKEIVPNDKLLKFIKKKLKIKNLSKFKSDKLDDFVEENIDELKELDDTITDLKSGKKENPKDILLMFDNLDKIKKELHDI